LTNLANDLLGCITALFSKGSKS